MNEQTVQNNDARILLGDGVEFGGTVNRTIHDFREKITQAVIKIKSTRQSWNYPFFNL